MRKRNLKKKCKDELGKLVNLGLLEALIDVDGNFCYIMTEKGEQANAEIVGVKEVKV